MYIALSLFLLACRPDDHEPINEPFELLAPSYFGAFMHRIPDDNTVTAAGVDLGRHLFYDKRLSANGMLSCGSCHIQEKAFQDGLPKAIGVNGAINPRASQALVNMLWAEHFNWDGSASSLEEQVRGPITNPLEMGTTFTEVIAKLEQTTLYPPKFEAAFGTANITEEGITKALAQFLRTLISADSKYDQYLRGEYQASQQELRGMQLFFTHPEPGIIRGGNCGDCHVGPLTAGAIEGFSGFHNNGLDRDENLQNGLMDVTGNPRDRGKFKAPGMRNIALRAPYMHDGRFTTLEEVLEHYDQHIQMNSNLDILILEGSNEPIVPGEPIKLHLTEQEKEDIIVFLHMLTDQTFITNPAFSNPFNP
jgi:cytochrome c peroxidase